MRLLLVADSGSLLALQISDDQRFVVHADTANEALSILRHEAADIVVVDIQSLVEDGFAFIRHLRGAKNDTPLMVLTGNYLDDVRALDLGADDAIALPADVSELRARIAALTRRHKGLSKCLAVVGELSLSLETREVTFRDNPVRLTQKEFSMLELLVVRKGQIVTKDMFLHCLYGGIDEPQVNIIDLFICKLRRRLSSVGANDIIDTIWGCGYKIRKIGEEGAVPDTVITIADGQHSAGRYD